MNKVKIFDSEFGSISYPENIWTQLSPWTFAWRELPGGVREPVRWILEGKSWVNKEQFDDQCRRDPMVTFEDVGHVKFRVGFGWLSDAQYIKHLEYALRDLRGRPL